MRGNDAVVLALFVTLAGCIFIYWFWLQMLKRWVAVVAVEGRSSAGEVAATA